MLLISAVQQSGLAKCKDMSPLLNFCPIQVTIERGAEFPVLYSRLSLVIPCIPSHVCMSIPVSQFTLSMSVLCLYFCSADRFICIIFLDSTYMP